MRSCPASATGPTVWLLRDLWHFHFYGETPLKLVAGRERIYFEHFWNDFAADRTQFGLGARPPRSTPRPMRSRARCAPASRCSAPSSRTPRISRSFAETKLTMPMLVLTGEKASGEFLIEQGRLVADNVEGVVIKGSGHWLIDEAPDQVIPKLVAFFRE